MITHTDQLLDYKNYLPFSNIFIETGTAAGDGVQRALTAGFHKVISIEAAEFWYKQSKERFKGYEERVYIYHDKSVEVLPGILYYHLNLKGRAVIFLDAHPAGPLSAGHQEWVENPSGPASQHEIIKAELKLILAHGPNHVIIIDDINGEEDGCAQQYMDMCLERNPNYTFEFWDENLSGNLLYKDKILVCLP